jgi:hypothetical protein
MLLKEPKTELEKKNLHNDLREGILTAQKKSAIIAGNQVTHSSGDL